MSIRDKILASVPATAEVDVPEWGEPVHVRAISAVRFLQAWDTESGPQVRNLRVVLASLCDAAGAYLFEPAEWAGVLETADVVALFRVIPVALRLNGLSEGDAGNA